MHRTTKISICLALFLAGLGCAKLSGGLNPIVLVLFIVLPAVSFPIRKRRPGLFWLSVAALFFVIGWQRGITQNQKLEVYKKLTSHSVTVEGRALEDAAYSDKGLLTFSTGSLVFLAPSEGNAIGEITIEGRGAPMVYRGDIIQASGRLYKKRGAQIAGISFASITVRSHYGSPLDNFRYNFSAGLQNVLPEQLASFGLGLLIGQRATLNKEFTDALITVGLIHIVAVSGYNLTVIIQFIQKRLGQYSRYQTVSICLAAIGLFLLISGFSASIVRAAVISSLGLIGWYYGRQAKPVLLILLVGALTAGVNPLYLWSNIGWYLSFTAFFGVLVIGPLLQDRFSLGNSFRALFLGVLFETVSAQLCTIPVILFIFGRLSVISIIANILVVPLVPLAMLLSLLAGFAGMTHLIFGSLIVIPARILLQYMLEISDLLAKIPFANVEIYITAPVMIFMYVCILAGAIVLWARNKKYAKITEKESL
jgi:competence protein ComEC